MQDYLIEFESAAQRFARVLAGADLTAPVPSCPGWTLADLAEHLGGIHQWATHAVVAGTPDGVPSPAPTDREALVDWYRESAGLLLSTLQSTDPQAPAWGFGPKPRTAAFWHRRQAHETTIHLWDATSPRTPTQTIDDALALDGIDELITIFFPRQVRLGRMPPLEQTLAVEVAGPDGAHRWVIAGDGTTAAADPDIEAMAAIKGPAPAVLLLLWGRFGLDHPELTIDGDLKAAEAVLNSPLTP